MNTEGKKAFVIKIAIRLQKEDIVHPEFEFNEVKIDGLYSVMQTIFETEFGSYDDPKTKYGVSVAKFEEEEDGLISFLGYISAFGFELDNKHIEEAFQMTVMNHICEFDFNGYRIFSDCSTLSIFNQGELEFEEMREKVLGAEVEISSFLIVEDMFNKITYVAFRDTEIEILNDIMNSDCEDYEDDNTFRPRTNDEILGDLGSDDEDDDY